jgi:hypothetical protein
LLTLHYIDLHQVLLVSVPYERMVVRFTANGDAGPLEGDELDVSGVDVWVLGDEVGA